jgi:hypothetical protein
MFLGSQYSPTNLKIFLGLQYIAMDVMQRIDAGTRQIT